MTRSSESWCQCSSPPSRSSHGGAFKRSARFRSYLNRELSWIDFDRRVLELAADASLPLLERVKFCAIASSNLDEFVAVRVAELHDQAAAGLARRAPDGRTPAQTLADARRAIVALQVTQDAIWCDDLRPALAAAKIRVCAPEDCRPRELRALRKTVERDVLPLLTPIAVGPGAPFPHVPSLSLNVAVVVGDERDPRFVCIRIPQDVPRFLEVGTRGVRVPVESAVVQFLPSLIGSAAPQMHAVFRVTRDADVSVAGDADDLLEALETKLRGRSFGDVVRLEVGGRDTARDPRDPDARAPDRRRPGLRDRCAARACSADRAGCLGARRS